MLEEIDPQLFDEWQAFSVVEPFGEEWVQTALCCSTTANTMGGKKGGGQFTVKDFLPQPPKKPVDEKTKAQMHRMQWEIFAAHRRATMGD